MEEYKSNVADVLRNCTFRDCDPIELRRQILKKIDSEGLSIRLFQYRSVSDAVIEGLTTGTLYFKSPVRFNDPYDSLTGGTWKTHGWRQIPSVQKGYERFSMTIFCMICAVRVHLRQVPFPL